MSSNPFDPLPTQGRLAGVDFGSVRIGLATCDPSQTWTTPYGTYRRRSEALDRQYFQQLAAELTLVGWVMGLPIHCDGQESEKSKQVRTFAQRLHKHTELPVALFDERFTTAEARRLLQSAPFSPQKKKERLDGMAAHLILTHYLESRRSQLDNQLASPLD